MGAEGVPAPRGPDFKHHLLAWPCAYKGVQN